MTNYEKWFSYTEGLPSPNNFIQWGWLYLIAASLQRRVWLGPPHQQCFANQYTILVSPPGIGKGLVIKEVTNCLRYHTLDVSTGNVEKATTAEDKTTAEMVVQSDLKHAQEIEYQGKSKGADTIKPLLIPVCADAITYEALVMAVGNSYRRINYTEYNEKAGKDILKIYGHSSLCFSLQELGSLMRKRTNDTVNYLLGLYDCPVDYEYSTLTRGKDRVRRGCLSILAGTTPSFMQSTFDEKLMDEGFSSRTFYIFATKNRKNQFFIPSLTKEQEAHRQDILDHVKKLTTLYGNVKIDPATQKFLDEWWNEQENDKSKRANKSLKLVPYYSRKNIHVMKVAMALHFGESTEMFIPMDTFQRAIKLLEREELNMSLAITLEGNNPISKVTRKIIELLHTGKKNYVDLSIETHTLVDRKGLDEALEFLSITEQITQEQIKDETIDKDVTYWRLK